MNSGSSRGRLRPNRPLRKGGTLKRLTRIETIVEHDEVVVVRRTGKAVQFWCDECRELVPMVRVEDAAALLAATPRAVYRWVEAGKLHFAESERGLVLVCAQSLAILAGAEKPAEKKQGENHA